MVDPARDLDAKSLTGTTRLHTARITSQHYNTARTITYNQSMEYSGSFYDPEFLDYVPPCPIHNPSGIIPNGYLPQHQHGHPHSHGLSQHTPHHHLHHLHHHQHQAISKLFSFPFFIEIDYLCVSKAYCCLCVCNRLNFPLCN